MPLHANWLRELVINWIQTRLRQINSFSLAVRSTKSILYKQRVQTKSSHGSAQATWWFKACLCTEDKNLKEQKETNDFSNCTVFSNELHILIYLFGFLPHQTDPDLQLTLRKSKSTGQDLPTAMDFEAIWVCSTAKDLQAPSSLAGSVQQRSTSTIWPSTSSRVCSTKIYKHHMALYVICSTKIYKHHMAMYVICSTKIYKHHMALYVICSTKIYKHHMAYL